MTAEIINRKGARKAEDIPKEVFNLLNKGEIETVNLTEWLAIDHLELITHAFVDCGIAEDLILTIKKQVLAQKKPSTMKTTKLVGKILYESYPNGEERTAVFHTLSKHPSDSIRCYAPFLISLDDQLPIGEKLKASKALVADKHFGVREVIWIALRPEIAKYLEESIQILATWTLDEDSNIRRFTTEATRPRGVWCKHIELLKTNPELGLPILSQLNSDPAKYVQDSVGNWLNDASKSQPKFVLDLCNEWELQSPTKATTKIIKRAKRTLDKK